MNQHRLTTMGERRYWKQIEQFRKLMSEHRQLWLDQVLLKHVPPIIYEALQVRATWALDFIHNDLHIRWERGEFREHDDKTIVLYTHLWKGQYKIETFEFVVQHNGRTNAEQLYKDVWNLKN